MNDQEKKQIIESIKKALTSYSDILKSFIDLVPVFNKNRDTAFFNLRYHVDPALSPTVSLNQIPNSCSTRVQDESRHYHSPL